MTAALGSLHLEKIWVRILSCVCILLLQHQRDLLTARHEATVPNKADFVFALHLKKGVLRRKKNGSSLTVIPSKMDK